MLPRAKLKQTSLFSEIVVDNFAGGGGASMGIGLAIGRSVDIAINHDPNAILMHRLNHLDTEHYCESVWDVDPRKITSGRPVALCWFSPDCKHHSKARGDKPRDKNIRGLAWIAVRWAATVQPRVIMLENVEEFQTWGPLTKDGKLNPRQKGRTFRTFVNALQYQGYTVEYRELRACDYGAPTLRKRFFMIARRDGKPIIWPEPTHGDPKSEAVKSGRLKPWRTAAEIIDWSLPCPSIFERKKPLAENTLRRIAKGIMKFVVNNPEPFIVKVNHTSDDFRGQSIDDPLQTITAKNGYGIVTPYIVGAGGPTYMGKPAPVDSPLGTVISRNHRTLIAHMLIQYHTEQSEKETRGQMLTKPLMVVDASPRYALVASHIIKLKGSNIGHSVNEPIQTITAGGLHFGEVRTFLIKYYGTGEGQSLQEPLHTITVKDRFGLVTIHGEDYEIVDIGMRMLEPRELFNAQSFPRDYIIDSIDERGRHYPKSEQVARCGNAVPPVFAEALVLANLPELCAEYRQAQAM